MTPYQLQLLSEIANLIHCIRQANDYAAGVLLANLQQVVQEYWATIREDYV